MRWQFNACHGLLPPGAALSIAPARQTCHVLLSGLDSFGTDLARTWHYGRRLAVFLYYSGAPASIAGNPYLGRSMTCPSRICAVAGASAEFRRQPQYVRTNCSSSPASVTADLTTTVAKIRWWQSETCSRSSTSSTLRERAMCPGTSCPLTASTAVESAKPPHRGTTCPQRDARCLEQRPPFSRGTTRRQRVSRSAER